MLRNSLRNQIILPFVAIVSIMTLACAFIAVIAIRHYSDLKLSLCLEKKLSLIAIEHTALKGAKKAESVCKEVLVFYIPKGNRNLEFKPVCGDGENNKALLQRVDESLRKNPDKMMLKIQFEKNNYLIGVADYTFKNRQYGLVVANKKEFVTPQRFVALIIIFIVLINTLIAILYIIRIYKTTRALEHLSDVATQISKGDYEQEICVGAKDEVGQLSQTFKIMIESIKSNSAQLVNEKNKFEAIIAGIPEGIVVTDLQNKLIFSNTAIKKIFHASSDDKVQELVLQKIGNQEILEKFREKDWSPHKPYLREISHKGKNHKVRTFIASSSLLLTEDKETLGLITILRDITQDKELEELRDGFLRTVTHELRTPLTSIMGFLELVKGSKGISATNKEWVSISLKEASNLKALIDDLLDLSQIKAGRIRIHLEQINVSNMLTSIMQIFAPMAVEKNLDLQLSAIDPELVVMGDSTKLRRVLVNLISNAMKFTEDGHIRLDCTLEEERVVFSVTDTGIGIKEDETAVIFEKFRQVDYSSTRQFEGIGLGLSIVKQLVEMHGGEVWVDSVYGRGTSFYFSIPKSS